MCPLVKIGYDKPIIRDFYELKDVATLKLSTDGLAVVILGVITLTGLPSTSMETNLLFPVLPFYFIARQNLVGDISDTTLALMCPVIAFWMFSVFFDLLDNSGWRFFEQYRIHESNEIKSRNLATKSEVVINVIAGYLIQTIVGIIYLNDLPDISLSHCSMELEEMQTTLVCFIKWMARPKLLVDLLIFHKTSIVYWLYW
ncbi:hypothetical protein V8B97DRAFT_2109426 [Scleroderma yunnanense]